MQFARSYDLCVPDLGTIFQGRLMGVTEHLSQDKQLGFAGRR